MIYNLVEFSYIFYLTAIITIIMWFILKGICGI